MREKIQEGIEYFGSRYAELFGDKRRKSEELGFTYMLTADIQEQALKEAINRTLKGLTGEIEKGLLTGEEIKEALNSKFGTEHERFLMVAQAQLQKILSLLKE